MKLTGMIAVMVLAVSSVVALPATAAEQSPKCPKMQFVVVRSAQDSTDTNADQGFLGEVVSPVVDAANTGKKLTSQRDFPR